MLIALAARVAAAPRPDPIDPAIRDADVLTGTDADAAKAIEDEDEDENQDEDGKTSPAAERAAEIDGGGDEDGDHAEAAGPDPAEVAGELGGADPAFGDDTAEDPLAEPDEADAESLAVTADGPDALPADAGTGALAGRDAELDPQDPIAGVNAADAAVPADAAEVYEQWTGRRRPSRWGRLDVGVGWRSRWSEPMHAPAHHTSELWLVATWRR